MPLFTVTYRDDVGKPPEAVEAERVELEAGGASIVLRRTVLVMSCPREVVVARFRACEVQSVDGLS